VKLKLSTTKPIPPLAADDPKTSSDATGLNSIAMIRIPMRYIVRFILNEKYKINFEW